MPNEDELRARLTVAVARGDRRAEAIARFGLGDATRHRGGLAESRQEYGKAADLFRAAAAGKELSTTLNNLGLVCIALNDFNGARVAYDEAIDLSSRAGDFNAVRRLLGNFAGAVADAGDVAAARQLHEQALEIAATSRDVAGMARAHSNLAWMDLLLGRASAVTHTGKAAELGRGVTDPRLLGAITHTHALVCLREHDYARSVRESDWCRRTFAYVGDADWVALSISTASIAAAAGGEWHDALRPIASALEAIVAGPLRRGVAKRCVGLAGLARHAGEMATANDLLNLAESVAAAPRDEPLAEAVQAERHQTGAATAAGAGVLTSCRAMFLASVPAVGLVPIDVPWLDRRYGERPPAPAPAANARGLTVGPLELLDLTAEGHGWSVFQDLTGLLGTETNYDAEERIRAAIERQDPLLAKSLEYDTEGDNVSIVAKTREDILAVAAWILSMAGVR